MKIDLPTSYSAVTRHWHVLFEFEKNLPYHWRCRPAWVALISISGSEEAAVQTSPEINKLDLRLTFQRHTLALNIADGASSPSSRSSFPLSDAWFYAFLSRPLPSATVLHQGALRTTREPLPEQVRLEFPGRL